MPLYRMTGFALAASVSLASIGLQADTGKSTLSLIETGECEWQGESYSLGEKIVINAPVDKDGDATLAMCSYRINPKTPDQKGTAEWVAFSWSW